MWKTQSAKITWQSVYCPDNKINPEIMGCIMDIIKVEFLEKELEKCKGKFSYYCKNKFEALNKNL